MNNFLFLGPPGSGKGTQAKKLSAKFAIPHIALGDILREAVRNGTEVGKIAKEFIDAGKLVPDEVTIRLTKERLAEKDCAKGFILDGFPRSLKQAEALDQILANISYKVLYFKVPLESVIDRNCGRFSCPDCGAVFHIKYMPSTKGDICDKCGGKLYQRKDDVESVIRERFKVYEESTSPVVELYTKRGNIFAVDAEGDIEDVFNRLLSIIAG